MCVYLYLSISLYLCLSLPLSRTQIYIYMHTQEYNHVLTSFQALQQNIDRKYVPNEEYEDVVSRYENVLIEVMKV